MRSTDIGWNKGHSYNRRRTDTNWRQYTAGRDRKITCSGSRKSPNDDIERWAPCSRGRRSDCDRKVLWSGIGTSFLRPIQRCKAHSGCVWYEERHQRLSLPVMLLPVMRFEVSGTGSQSWAQSPLLYRDQQQMVAPRFDDKLRGYIRHCV